MVSTQEPGRRRSDSENGDSLDSIVNGDLEVNVDIEMDNEAFGIDSTEMVTNATAAATEAVIPPITTPARAEEVPPMESSEEQEQETENHEPEPVPEVAPTGNGEVNDAKTEEALPKEVKTSDKDAPESEEETSDETEKLLYPDEVEPTSPEACALDSKEEPLSNVVGLAGTEVLDQKEQNEAPAQESHDTSEPAATEKPPTAIAPEANNDSADDGEPKAKMAKLSQEEPESETADLKPTTVPAEKSSTDPDKDTVSSESTTDSNGSSVEFVDNSNSPEERAETAVVLLPTSVDSVVSNADVNIASDEIAEAGVVLLSSSVESDVSSVNNISSEEISETRILPSSSPDATLSESSSVCTVANPVPTAEQESKQVELERPAKQATTDEPQAPDQTSEAPSEPAAVAAEPVAHIAEENDETIVKRINLEASPPSTTESEQPTAPRVNADDMETLSSAVVPENVMATDEEEQQQPGAVDAVVPMAADASETAKPDENAMDIDESSVEPMDQ